MNDAHYSFSNLFLGKPLLKRECDSNYVLNNTTLLA